MENVIILGVVVVIVLLGIRPTIKHFKGEGGCCGGGSTVRPRPKKLEKVVEKRILTLEGMTCENCRNRVEGSLNDMEGVSARVSLKKKQAVVSMDRLIPVEKLKETVEKAGYQVTDVR